MLLHTILPVRNAFIHTLYIIFSVSLPLPTTKAAAKSIFIECGMTEKSSYHTF